MKTKATKTTKGQRRLYFFNLEFALFFPPVEVLERKNPLVIYFYGEKKLILVKIREKKAAFINPYCPSYSRSPLSTGVERIKERK